MEIYRWEGKGFRQLDPLRFEEERDFEDLLEQDPNLLLGKERICIISRQVPIGKSQKVDLLALDRQGNCIVIELKRGKASSCNLRCAQILDIRRSCCQILLRRSRAFCWTMVSRTRTRVYLSVGTAQHIFRL